MCASTPTMHGICESFLMITNQHGVGRVEFLAGPVVFFVVKRGIGQRNQSTIYKPHTVLKYRVRRQLDRLLHNLSLGCVRPTDLGGLQLEDCHQETICIILNTTLFKDPNMETDKPDELSYDGEPPGSCHLDTTPTR